MQGYDLWDGVIIAGAVLVAVASLTRLMRARRNLLIGQVRQQLANEQARRAAEAKKQKKEGAA